MYSGLLNDHFWHFGVPLVTRLVSGCRLCVFQIGGMVGTASVLPLPPQDLLLAGGIWHQLCFGWAGLEPEVSIFYTDQCGKVYFSFSSDSYAQTQRRAVEREFEHQIGVILQLHVMFSFLISLSAFFLHDARSKSVYNALAV